MTTTEHRTEHTVKLAVLLVVLALLVGGCFLVLRPFLSALLWAIVLCFSSWPLYTQVLRLVRGRCTLAASIMTAITTLAMLAPFAVITLSLVDDVQNATEATRGWLADNPTEPPAWFGRVPLVGKPAGTYWREVGDRNAERIAQLRKHLEPVKTWLVKTSLQLGGGLAEVGLSLFILFFLYRDGVVAADKLRLAIERLGEQQARAILEVAGNTVRGVVYGILGTALAQGVVAGIGFLIAGVPRAAFLALLTFFLSVVPMGPPLVWVPAAIWLFQQGSIGWGIFMVIWGLLVSSVDNVLKPLIISRGSDLPFVLILFGIVGGALAFGFIGVFLGPTLMAIGFRVLAWWSNRPTEEIAS